MSLLPLTAAQERLLRFMAQTQHYCHSPQSKIDLQTSSVFTAF